MVTLINAVEVVEWSWIKEITKMFHTGNVSIPLPNRQGLLNLP